MPRKLIYYLAWLQALVATSGSLYFSEVRHFTPCILCWYQRILMYPLVLIIAVGLLLKDKKLPYYVLPLSLLGWSIALFHNLLNWGIITEKMVGCIQGVSCTTRYVGYFGFLTIPLMSLTAFTVISLLILLAKRQK